MSKHYYEFKPYNVGRWIIWSLFALILFFAPKVFTSSLSVSMLSQMGIAIIAFATKTDPGGAYPGVALLLPVVLLRAQMTTFNSGPTLNLADMPSALQHHHETMESKAMAAAVSGAVREIRNSNGNGNGHSHRSPDTPGVLTLSEMERRHITEVLRFTNGDRTTAALLLGIGRTTLYRKMKCYQIQA